MNEEEIRKQVEERLSSEHPGLALVGAGIAGFIGFALSGALASSGIGLIAIAYLLFFKKRHQEAWAALDRGEYAHLLNADERLAYERIYGRKGYQNARAGDYSHAVVDVPVSPKAVHEAQAQKVQAVQHDVVEEESAVATIALDDEPLSDDELRAISMTANAIVPIGQAPQKVTVSAPPKSPVTHLIGRRLRTTLITSVSGGGKDIVLSNGVRHFIPLHPDFKILIMDCKDDPKEYAYYDGLPNVEVFRLNVAISSDREVVRWVDKCLDQFLAYEEKALLIVNEGTLIRAKSKRYVDVIAGLVSSGDSREKYAWEAGQSAHTDDLRVNGAARSRFRMLIIGLLGEEMQVEAVLQAKFVPDSAKNMEDIKMQMRRSPVQRAWCDGQNWYSMPTLKNYSGYNRDERKYIENEDVPISSPLTNSAEGNPFNIEEAKNLATEGDRSSEDTQNKVVSLPPISENDAERRGTDSTCVEKDVTASAEGDTAILLTPETVLSRYQETETVLVSRISEGVLQGLSPSDIVKQSLKLGKDRYLEGKALCIYLVRKHGNSAIILHFRKWLDE